MKTVESKLFYGYYIVGACFIILFMLWGMVLNTFPIFFRPISQNMGWSREGLSYALLAGAVGVIISAPIAGKLIDRIGAKPVMIAGTLIIGVGLLLGSQVKELWHICTIFGFIGCGLMCASIIPCSFIISNWFISRRGTAMGVAFVGTSVGGAIMSLVANEIILRWGWRTAFVFSGLTILCVVVPTIQFVIRTHPSEMGLKPYRTSEPEDGVDDNWGLSVKEAFGQKAFWQIAAIMLIVGLVTGGVGNHLPSFLQDKGHSERAASFAWSFVMWVMILGKLAVGPVSDRWGAKNAMAVACVMFAVSIPIFSVGNPYALVLFSAALYGFASGAPLTANPLLIAENLGTKNFGALYGVLNILGTLGGAVGPVVAGASFTRLGSYLPVFYLFAGCGLAAAVCAITIRSKAIRVHRERPLTPAETR
ncbi:MAG: MFS transporter [Candidatus Abyssubacteria bacterium]